MGSVGSSKSATGSWVLLDSVPDRQPDRQRAGSAAVEVSFEATAQQQPTPTRRASSASLRDNPMPTLLELPGEVVVEDRSDARPALLTLSSSVSRSKSVLRMPAVSAPPTGRQASFSSFDAASASAGSSATLVAAHQPPMATAPLGHGEQGEEAQTAEPGRSAPPITLAAPLATPATPVASGPQQARPAWTRGSDDSLDSLAMLAHVGKN